MLLGLGDLTEKGAETHFYRHECVLRSVNMLTKCLSFHRRLHNEEKGHGCEYCGKHFQDSMRLRMHMLSHTGTLQLSHSSSHSIWCL